MLARFINTHTAPPAFLPLPEICEATLDLPVAHFRRFLTQGAAKCAQRRFGIYANSDDETDSLERRARDVVRMHGDEDRSLQLLRQGSGCRPFGRHHMMGLAETDLEDGNGGFSRSAPALLTEYLSPTIMVVLLPGSPAQFWATRDVWRLHCLSQL